MFDPGFVSSLSRWLATPQGRYVMEWESAKFDALVADIFGFNAVQLGIPECDFLRANRMPLRLACGAPGEAVVLNTDFEALPFASASLDLVVLPHVLEFASHPHQVLREVERVLVPEGHVVIAGFNPLSLWGVRRRLAGPYGEFPWRGQYLSLRRLKDWLALLGFETRGGAFGCYVPAVTQEKWLAKWHFMDAAGDRWWPICGGVYIVQAIKRVQGMRLVTPNWRDR
ncbi:MAG: class I SAM-dependent methyltransferase, partial [Zoogloea sp.]|nr:class I SAM-dependent methyltransferase [Zoogloea sp.]